MRRLFPLATASSVLTVVLLSQANIASAVTYAPQRFTDVPSNAWFAAYIEQATEEGIVSGYKDQYGNLTGKFGPENPVTVAEALKIAMDGAGYDISLGVGFGHWAAKYMSVALGLRFQVALIPNLNLDRPATRAEVTSLIADAFKLQQSALTGDQYSDVTAATPYASAIQALSQADIISGDQDAAGNSTGRFRPNSLINRAETVKIIIGAREEFGLPGRSPSFSSSTSRSSSRSSGACSLQDCGPAPGMPNWQCSNGSLGGPSCERLPGSRCGWLIRECSVSSSSSSKHAAQTYTLYYTENGFQPSFVTIHVGDKVKFRNQFEIEMWVASNAHPTHTEYPEFDQHTSVGKNGDFTFTFTKSGVWGFHNHLRPEHQGVVSVDPQ